MTYNPNPDFQRDTQPLQRLTWPDECRENRVVTQLAALTERHGPWDACLILFGTNHTEAAA